jgi:hypothetical protein
VCTFTNTKHASLTVVKVTDPASDPQDFDFDLTGLGVPADLDLDTDGGDATLPSQQTFSLSAAQLGAHSVSESAVAGWSLTALDCTGDADFSETGSTATLDIDAGETVVCTFTNTKHGTIIVEKQTNPNGASGSFTFTGTAAGTISDNGMITVGNLLPGTYTSTEADPTPAFDLTSISCNDGSSTNVSTGDPVTRVATFRLDAGETVKCTFTNTKRPTIIVRKITTGIAGGPFTFTTTGDNGFTTPFDLTTVTPGVAVQQSFLIDSAGIGADFSVTESGVAAGFVLTDVGCIVTTAGAGGTSAGSSLATKTGTIDDLAAGATVTCTFTNSGVGTTRTQGFWSTHLSLAQLVWNESGGTVGGITHDGMTVAERSLCGQLLGVDDVMGAFWSNISKTSTGAKRSALDQGRMKLLQQMLAAILNNQLFGSSPSGVTIDQAKTAYCGIDLNAIKAAQSAMAAFNEGGDSGLFTPGASADPKAAKALADYVFWDVLP